MSGAPSRPRPRWVAVSLAALGIALYFIEARAAVFHTLPWVGPDSVSYLEANIARAPVYPLVLKAFAALPGGVAWLGRVQHAAFLAAGLVLAYQFSRTYGRPLLALLLAVIVLANPALVSYCFTLVPEALLVALLMVHLSLVLAVAREWRRGTLIGLGTTAATLALIKPVGYAIFAGLAIIALAWRGQWRTFPWMIAPAVAVLLAACTGNYVARGVFATQAQGGYSRVAYVGHLLDESTASRHGDVARRISNETAPIGHALEQLPGPTIYYLIAANQNRRAERLARREIIREFEREHGVTVDDVRDFPRDAAVTLAINRIGGHLADAAVRAHPLAYARHVAANFFGLWWLPLIQNRDTLPALRARIDEELARHPILIRADIPFRALPWPAFVAVRALLLAAIVCGIGGLALVWSAWPERRVVGYAAAVLNGYFLLVSVSQPGLPRYALTVWPVSMLLVFSAVAAAAAARTPR